MPLRLTRPKWANRQHPIVFYELRHWERSRPWNIVKRALWGSAAVFLFLPVTCALIFGVTANYNGPTELVVTFGGLFAFGALVLSGLAETFMLFVANIIGATLIARERETQAWPFLRLTLLTNEELVGGKLVALIYILREPLLLVLVLRGLALLGGLVTLALVLALTPPALAQAGTYLQTAWQASASETLLLISGVGLTLVTLLVSLILLPFLNLSYNALISLATSTFLRRRNIAVVVTFVVHFGINLGIYAPIQQFLTLMFSFLASNSLNTAPTTFNYLGTAPAIVFFVPVITQLVQYGLMLGVMVASYFLAVHRVAQLSE